MAIGMTILLGLKIVISIKVISLSWFTFERRLMRSYKSLILMNAPRNAQYTSKTIQNEVIGKDICDEILFEINTAKYYSVITNEVTEISNKCQLPYGTFWVMM